MSSTIKRVALVAVAALGLGSVTAISANAAASALSVVQKAGTGDNGSGAIAGPANTVTITVSAKNDATQSWAEYVTISGADATFNTVTGGTITVPANAKSAILAQVTENTATTKDLVIATPTAGTITVNVYTATAVGASTYNSTPDATLSITVRTTGVSGVVSASNSTSVISAGTDFTGASADEAVISSNIGTAQAASILVTLKDANGNAVNTAPLTAVLSGQGLIGASATEGNVLIANTAASSRAVTVADTVNGIGVVTVSGDGTGIGGVSTVSIYSGTTLIATESVTFHGKAVSLVVKQVASSLLDTSAGDTTITADKDGVVATIEGKDAQGTVFPLAASQFTAITSTVVTAQNVTAAAFGDGDGDPVAATAAFVVDPAATYTGAKTFTITHTSTGLTANIEFVVGLAAATTISVEGPSDSLVPGQKYTIKVTSKDAGGFANPDGTRNLTIATSRASSVAVPTSAAFVNGVASIDLYAPITAGSFTVTVTDASVATATATISVEIANSAQDSIDAANEATDAANAATDAANAAAEAADAATAAAQDAQAAVAALATQVASLIAGIKAQITTLTNLVIKIQKKVKA